MRCHPAAIIVAVFLTVTTLLGCHSGDGPTSPGSALVGVWGADGGIVELTGAGGTLRFHCAIAELDEAVHPASDGVFSVGGWYSRAVGPEPYSRQEALFRGRVRGTELELNVTLVSTGRTVQMLVLQLDVAGQVRTCR